MSEIVAKKNTDRHIARPAINKVSPESYISGEVVLDVAYSKTGAGAWTSITLSDSMVEIFTTGIYEMTVLASEIVTVDFLAIKLTSTNMADDMIILDLRDKLIDDLNDFDPAVDIVARVTLVDKVTTVDNIVNVTTITSSATQVCDVFNSVQPYRPGVSGIMENVRDSLTDPNRDKYTEERLVRLLDKAQKDLNIRAKLLKAKVVFQLSPNQELYTLPIDTRTVTRVNNINGNVPILSHTEADLKYGSTWESDTGDELLAIIYDKQNQKGFKTYPRLNDPTGENTLYVYNQSSDFGIEGVIEGSIDDDYGLIVIDEHGDFDSDYGLIATFIEHSDKFRVTMYTNVNAQSLTVVQDPNTLVYTYSGLQIPDTYDTILEHYVIGAALRDNVDTQNRDLGKEHLSMYANLVIEALADSSSSNINIPDKPTRYNSAL